MSRSSLVHNVMPSEWMAMLDPDAEQKYEFDELKKRSQLYVTAMIVHVDAPRFGPDVESQFTRMFWFGEEPCQIINIVAKCDYGIEQGNLGFLHVEV